MRVHLKHKAKVAWRPATPEEAAKFTPGDLASHLVKPARRDDGSTGYDVQVKLDEPGETLFCLGEHTIVHHMFHDKWRTLKPTRAHAVVDLVAEMLEKGHGDPRSVTAVTVDDDGADAALCRAELAPHVDGRKGPDAEALEEHVKAYMQPADIAAALRKHFRVKPAKEVK